MEQTYERLLEHPKLPFPVLIKGNVDRIENRDGVIRIIDYKTGKYDSNKFLKPGEKGEEKELFKYYK